MDVNNVVFVWKSFDENGLDFGNIKRLEIIFNNNVASSIVCIDTGNIKVEDRTFGVDAKEVLKKIRNLINNEEVDRYEFSGYVGNGWELYVDDKKYEGIFEYPAFVSKIRKIIKLDIILMIANKKIANYIKK